MRTLRHRIRTANQSLTSESLLSDINHCATPHARTLPVLTPFIALSEQDLLAVFDLRYRNYADHDHIRPTPERLFYDKYDALPNCVTFGVRAGNTVVGSVRLCVHMPSRGWLTIPAKEAYGTAFEVLAARHPVLLECNRFVVDGAAERGADIQTALWACVAWFATRFQSATLLAAVRPPHIRYYRRLGFEPASAPQLYPGTTFTATLMSMDWPAHRDRLTAHPRFGRYFAGDRTIPHIPASDRRLFEARFVERRLVQVVPPC
jgi:hypothetical protein